MSRTDDVYKPALSGKKIPILTLDHNWHKLFSQAHVTPEIEKLENQVNELLKKQGKNTTEQKSVKALKKKIMDEIVDLADKYDETKDQGIQKKIDEHKRLVQECNDKLDALRDEALDIPRELDQMNYQLMLKTMEACYDRLDENMSEIKKQEDWINKIRVELKKVVIRKQEKEVDTYELYSYMHNIFGPDVINIFDMHYHPEKFAPKPKQSEDTIYI